MSLCMCACTHIYCTHTHTQFFSSYILYGYLPMCMSVWTNCTAAIVHCAMYTIGAWKLFRTSPTFPRKIDPHRSHSQRIRKVLDLMPHLCHIMAIIYIYIFESLKPMRVRQWGLRPPCVYAFAIRINARGIQIFMYIMKQCPYAGIVNGSGKLICA